MAEQLVFDRLDRLERQMSELTTRVYRLEGGPERSRVAQAPARAAAAVVLEPAAPPKQEQPILGPSIVGASAAPPAPDVPLAPAAAAPLQQGGATGIARANGLPAFARPEIEPPAPPTDWETVLGGNWLNKIGAVVLVVGLALLLGYSFTHMGPAGRDAVGLCGGLAMLGAGVFYERRPRYQSFARGLIGGGWAAVYFTVYAMRALDSARVIQSEIAGAVLLILVAAGMIAHALRYRSEAVVGVAYFGAFVALAISQVTSFSVFALIPLAASLLYIARRFRWLNLALFGLIATYAVCASRGDSGAPLWSVQALFAVYWLLFEGFEILVPGKWLAPWNALGFLSISILKWQASDPAHLWAFLAAAAVAYAAGGALRARLHPEVEPTAGGWHAPATLAAGLGVAAMLLRLHHQWLLVGLAGEAELIYLLGLRSRANYLRWMAAPLFALELMQLTAGEIPGIPVSSWAPAAAVTAALFYANRLLCASDVFYGYAGAGVAALIGGYAAPARECGRVWFLLAGGPFIIGWWRRLADFRNQGYLLACLAVVGTAVTWPHPPLSAAFGVAAGYALAACALYSAADRFRGDERSDLFDFASSAGALFLAAWLYSSLPRAAWGPAWAAEALLLAAIALRIERVALRVQSCTIALAAFVCCWMVNLSLPDAMLAAAIPIACFYAAQLLSGRGDKQRLFFSLMATALTSGLLYYKVSGSVLTVAWGAQGLALLGAGFPLRDRMLRLAGLALLLFCILKLFVYDLSYLETLPRIFSFLVLGLILVGVSWVYTRFRERVARYL